MAAIRDGRWFWWVLAGCVLVLGADVAGLGPFTSDADDPDLRTGVEVLGDTVEREPLTTTSTSTTPASTSTTSTTLSEAEALERLEGLDQETLDALEEIKGVDPADLAPPTTAR